MQEIPRLGDACGPSEVLARLDALRPCLGEVGRALVERTRKAVPFDVISVAGLDAEGYRLGSGTILWSNLPASYLAIYFGEKISQVDRTLQLAITRQAAATDAEVRDGAGDHGFDPRLDDLLRHYGVRHRTVVPLSRAGRVYGGVVATSQRPLTEDEQAYLELVAQPLHATLSRPYMARANAALRLGKGEMLCLRLAADGYTSEEIAGRSRYTSETVNSYMKTATRKLGAANRLQAVAEALRRGLIT